MHRCRVSGRQPSPACRLHVVEDRRGTSDKNGGGLSLSRLQQEGDQEVAPHRSSTEQFEGCEKGRVVDRARQSFSSGQFTSRKANIRDQKRVKGTLLFVPHRNATRERDPSPFDCDGPNRVHRRLVRLPIARLTVVVDSDSGNRLTSTGLPSSTHLSGPPWRKTHTRRKVALTNRRLTLAPKARFHNKAPSSRAVTMIPTQRWKTGMKVVGWSVAPGLPSPGGLATMLR